MGVDQAGQNGRAATVDPFRPGVRETAELAASAEREDATAADRDRVRHRPARIERHDPRVLEQPVGARQSDEGSGFASFTFISWSQHVMLPVPALLQRISVPQPSHR